LGAARGDLGIRNGIWRYAGVKRLQSYFLCCGKTLLFVISGLIILKFHYIYSLYLRGSIADCTNQDHYAYWQDGLG
jgi:hypothetical protein